MTMSSTLTATSLTRSTTTATSTSSTGTSSTHTATLTTSSTSTRTITGTVTQTQTEVPISEVTTSLQTTSNMVSSSPWGEMIVVEGVVSFARDGVSQSVAETAVASTLSRVTGLLPSRIRTSAQAFAKLRRRLSGVWRVNFEIDVLAAEETAVMQRLQQLKNSKSFADNLKEELQFRGGDPVSDFNVGLVLASDQGSDGGGGEDSTETIIIVAAVVACVIMLGAFAWKVCSGPASASAKESDELLKTKEDADKDPAPAPSETSDAVGSGNGYERGSNDDGLPALEPNSLAVGVGSIGDDGMSFYPGGRVPEREVSEPPLPPPMESPTIHGVCYEVPEETDPINLTDVQPEVTGKRQKVAPEPQWSLRNHQLTPAVCQSLTPSSWTGSLIWTEPPVHQTIPLPLSKEYRFNFQRAGRLAGHCFDNSCQYKITGKHRESGDLTWREVPQSSAGMAIECHGRIQMHGTSQCSSFEIVGVFSAVSTTISARHLGSGRFNLTTFVRPTSFGNTQELL